MNEVDPKQFFETWLPSAYERFAHTNDVSSVADVSCLATVESESWRVALMDGTLSVTSGQEGSSPTFRLATDRKSFDKLVAEAATGVPSATPAPKALRLDAETCRLVANVPGGLQLIVKEGEERFSISFGPGSRDALDVACTVTCDMQDVRAVKEGRANPMELFMNGRLNLEGNIEVAMALGGLFL